MAIFSSFLKSPPESPTARSVPNGGLGGFVQLRGKTKNAAKIEGGKSETKRTETDPTSHARKQPPPPIRVNSVDIGSAPIQSAPLAQDSENRVSPAALWKISHPPIKSATGTAFVVAEVEVPDLRELSSKLLWKESTHHHTGSEGNMDGQTEMTAMAATNNIPSPVELPGSLLLPDRGFRSEDGTASPPYPSTRPRAHSEQPSVTASVKHTTPVALTSNDGHSTKAGHRGNKAVKQPKSKDKSATSTEASTPTQVTSPTDEMLSASNVNILSAEDLIRLLPKMKVRKLATEWLPAMEKEIGKYKGLLHMYSNRSEVHTRHIDSICLDLKNLLIAMKSSAGIPNEQFAKAQADIDAQQRTDLEKLQHTEDELQEAQQACSSMSQEMDIRAPAFQHLKSVLYRVVATLGGCIRNNLAFRLYHSSEGLSEEVVKVLRAYKQWDDHTLKTFPSLVPAELYETAEQKAKELERQLTECQKLITKQQMAISRTTDANDELINQLQHSKEETDVQKGHIKTLEEEIATLREKVSLMPDGETSLVGRGGTTADGVLAELAGDDIVTMYARQTSQLEERSSVIVEQNALIEDLLRKVNEFSSTHDHDSIAASSPEDYFQTGHLPSDQVTLDRSLSSSGNKRILGSRTLSRAITPISRSMSNLLSSQDNDSQESLAHSDSTTQELQDPHQSPTFQSTEHNEVEDSQWPGDEQDTQPSPTKKRIIAPYPRDSIIGIESLTRLKIATQQSVQRNLSIRSNSSKSSSKSRSKRNSIAHENLPLNKSTQPNSSVQSNEPSTSSEYSNIANQPHEVSPIPLISVTSPSPPPTRQARTIIQGLRDVQLPARLVSDTRTMSEHEKKTLSLISEKSDDVESSSLATVLE